MYSIQVSEGKVWDELNVVSALNAYRKEQPLSRGPSFETIAAFGSNGSSFIQQINEHFYNFI